MEEFIEAEEKLRAVGARASVGHWKDAWAGMLVDEILIFEPLSVNGLSSCSIEVGKVSSLGHEAWDDSVKHRFFKVQFLSYSTHAFLTSAKGPEVLRSFRGIWEKIDLNPSSIKVIDGDVEEYSRTNFAHTLSNF